MNTNPVIPIVHEMVKHTMKTLLEMLLEDV